MTELSVATAQASGISLLFRIDESCFKQATDL